MNPHRPSTPPATLPANAPLELVERLAEDMVRRWHAGERPIAEEYFDRYPPLWENPAAALELIAEELALRAEHQQPAPAEELAGRFPAWRAAVLALLECQVALGQVRPRFPEAGTSIGEFELRSELGRGGEGRVFLAEQPLLAGRLVVLKLSPLGSCEHLCLARLQHSHIVPLYSAHEFPERGLLGLCMPYFGGATLATLWQQQAPLRSGHDLLAALPTTPPARPAPGSAWFVLEHSSLVAAVCWLGACLAEALEYAHERGLVHLDVKPSNILLAGDGTPMLLDFHLAHPPVQAGQVAPDWLGGTLGFMAPEHQAAFAAVQAGQTIVTPIDGRADVYALGVVLKQFLAIHAHDQPLSPGLADILDRCTQAAPMDRYPSAGALASDLRRHLADLPLQGVRNRSLRERWTKWRRRRPHVLTVALSLTALALVGIGLLVRSQRQVTQAATALDDGRAHLQAARYTEAASRFREGEELLDWLPFQRHLRQQLRDGRHTTERAEVAVRLRHLSDRVRPLYAAEVVAPAQIREAAARCRTVWNERTRLAAQLEADTSTWRYDLLDVGILTAHLECRAAHATPTAHRQALATLAEAATLLGPSRVLQLEQAAHLRALGQQPQAIPTEPPQRAWEHLALARQHYAAGAWEDALRACATSLAAEPTYDGYYQRGLCYLAHDQAPEAIADFSAAIALAPHSPWCFYNRSLAYTNAGRLDPALADCNRTLEIDPQFAQAYLARAAIHRRLPNLRAAHDDLDRALRAGLPEAAVHYERALVYVAENNRPAAMRLLEDCLAASPQHPSAHALLQQLRSTLPKP